MRRSRRGLTASEAALWSAVAETVTPIEPRPAGAVVPEAARLDEAPPRRERPAPRPPALRPPDAPASPPARLGAGDPKQARRVARGRRRIDAVLDLHGLTQDAAFARLCRFVETAHHTGARTLLVVTGKGAGEARVPFAESPRGVLRERFLEWVEQDPLRSRIASVGQAHQRHGGRGAFYVMVRRER